jgi:phosphatidylserine decarboxylase
MSSTMPSEPTRYWHRAKHTVEIEQIYGERWVRFAYENPVGRLAVALLVRRAVFSWYFGWRMNRRYSATKILPFIVDYGLDVDEFAKSALAFRTFNEFFCRALKPAARPIAPGEDVAVLPADGRHLVFPDVGAADGFYVKGAKFTLAELLGEADLPPAEQTLAGAFAGGAMLISRLAPVDCHRFLFPTGGVAGEPRLLRGWLYSVHPIALRRNLRHLVENRRMVTLVTSTPFGSVAMIEIGATNVGRIRQLFLPGRTVAKGEEKGLFGFGGSCIVTLFARGRIRFDADLIEQSGRHLETYAKMGERLGTAVPRG